MGRFPLCGRRGVGKGLKKRLKGFDILKTTFKPKNSPFHVVK